MNIIVGIYKITNLINQHCYIGQSRNIEQRWQNHKICAFNMNDEAYNYPLYQAIRKYGLNNFLFEVIETCSIEELNNKESYWIKQYAPEYNQTTGGDYQVVIQKLTIEQVEKITQILLNDKTGDVSHAQLAKEFNVSQDTIRDINVGRTWRRTELNYPLHFSKYDADKPESMKRKNFCIDCGKEISKGAQRCLECENKRRKGQSKTEKPVTREELKMLIRNYSFTSIGQQYGVTDNAIRKWCDVFNLPRTKKDIKAYSDKEWEEI